MFLVRALAAAVVLTAACSPPGAAATTEEESGASRTVSSGAATATQANAGPCSLESVTGIWSLTHIEADEPGVEDFYARAPHEFIRFTPDAAFAYFATPSNLTDVDQIDQGINDADANDGGDFRVQFLASGQFLVTRDGQPFQIFECEIADSAGQGGAQPGDMIWTNAESMPRLYRVHRRLR